MATERILIGLCKDCRFWLPEDDELGQCWRVEEDHAKFRTSPKTSGNEEIDVRIMTDADFGCVQFEEEKQNAKPS